MPSNPETPAPDAPDTKVGRNPRRLTRLGRAVAWLALAGGVVLACTWVGLQSDWFEEYVRSAVEENVGWHLDRRVTIGSVSIDVGDPFRVVINDVRIANVRGAAQPDLARLRRVTIEGEVASWLRRRVRIISVEIDEPEVSIEYFPKGSKPESNIPRWRQRPPARFKLVTVIVDQIRLDRARFELLDARNDIEVHATDASALIVPLGKATGITLRAQEIVARVADSELIRIGFDGRLEAGYGRVTVRGRARGEGIDGQIEGAVHAEPHDDYTFRIAGSLDTAAVRTLFNVEPHLAGALDIDGTLHGDQSGFAFRGSAKAPALEADVYKFGPVESTFEVTNAATVVRVGSARFADGILSARYELRGYDDPRPQSLALEWKDVELAPVLEAWKIHGLGLASRANGSLTLDWSGDDPLSGEAIGQTSLTAGNPVAGSAPYPMAASGSAQFRIREGAVLFEPLIVDLPASRASIRGSMRLEDQDSNLEAEIDSSRFAELDELAYNFAVGKGEKDAALIGLGGEGHISATVLGRLETPGVAASIVSPRTVFNGVELGTGDIHIHFDGSRSTLLFERATFVDGDHRLELRGEIELPEDAPPVMDLEVDATRWPAAKAIEALDLELVVPGELSGHLAVRGTEGSGRIWFEQTEVAEGSAELHIDGTVDWGVTDEEMTFDLDIGADAYPAASVLAFLEVEDAPLEGAITGTLHFEGRLDNLEGAGAVTIRNGSIGGEPFEQLTTEIRFDAGTVEANDLEICLKSGMIRGQGLYRLADETFQFVAAGADIQIADLKSLGGLELVTGTLSFDASGSGDVDNTDVFLQANIDAITVYGEELPPGTPPTSLTLAATAGEISVHGSLAGLLQLDGWASVAVNRDVRGEIRMRIEDLSAAQPFLGEDAPTVAGALGVDLRLGGNLASVETIEADGSIVVEELVVAARPIAIRSPTSFAISRGVLTFDPIRVESPEGGFDLAGSIGLAGDNPVNLTANGTLNASILQLVSSDIAARGRIITALEIDGPARAPRVRGSVDLVDGVLKVAAFPQLFDKVRASLVFDQGQIRIDAFQANLGRGVLSAGGTIWLDGITPARYRLSISAKDVDLHAFEGISMTGSCDILIAGETDLAVVQGDIDIKELVYHKDFNVGASIVNQLLTKTRAVSKIAESWESSVALRLRISAPSLSMRNNLGDVTAGGELQVTGTMANPGLIGRVTVKEGGLFRVQNIDYRIRRGIIQFQSPFSIDPHFDFTAEAFVQEYDVTVNLVGTFDRLTPTVTSDPPISDLSLLTLIGGSSFAQQSGAIGQVESSLSESGRSMVYGGVASLVGKTVLPFADVVKLDFQGDSGSEPVVTLEERVSKDVRAIFFYNTSSSQNRQLIDWQVTPDLSIQLVRDSEADSNYLISAADARYRTRFGGRWNPRPSNGVSVDLTERRRLDAPAAPPQAEVAQLFAFSGLTIRSLTIKPDAEIDLRRVSGQVDLAEGEPLSIKKMQSTVARLFGMGEFRDVRIDAAPESDGVAITIVLAVRERIGAIRFSGAGELERGLRRQLSVRQGRPLRFSTVDRDADQMRVSLESQGYLKASVDPEIVFLREVSAAEVTFHVSPGPLIRIHEVQLEGDARPFQTSELEKRLRSKPGVAYRMDRAVSDADRLRGFLAAKGYRKASVRFAGHTMSESGEGAILRWELSLGELVVVEVSGVPTRSVKRLLPFRGSDSYSPDQIDRSIDRIVQKFQERGHFFAEVSVQEVTQDSRTVVTFDVKPGPVTPLREVRFRGNRQIGSKELRSAVAAERQGRLRKMLNNLLRQPVGPTRASLEEDRDAIESVYAREGFTTAVTKPFEIRRNRDGSIDVVFRVEEGPQTLLASVGIEGNDSFRSAQLPDLELVTGKPLNPEKLAVDLVNLRTFYSDRGFTDSRVTTALELGDGRTSAKLAYKVTEGPARTIGNVIVTGNDFTRDKVVRQTSQLKQGAPLSVRTAQEAQQRMYALGIFQRVDISLAGEAPSTGGPSDVVVSVDEGRNIVFTGAVGYSTEDGPRVTVNLAHRNLFGTGRYIGGELRQSSRLERYLLTYREPSTLDLGFPTELTTYLETQEQDVDAVFDRYGTYVESSKLFGPRLRAALRYEYRVSDCVEGSLCDSDVPLPGIPQENQAARVSSITSSVFRDTRDDPANPTRGLYTASSLEVAFPLRATEASFIKLYGQVSWSMPLGKGTTLALSTQLGAIEPTRDQTDDDVPSPERFFGGGESSHRAFELDHLGIEGQTLVCVIDEEDDLTVVPCTSDTPVVGLGGTALILGSIEYRFPLVGGVNGAVFVDAGNVWGSLSHIDIGEVRWGVGAGVRYATPIGPLRLDLGYKLDREPFEDPYAAFLTIGFPF